MKTLRNDIDFEIALYNLWLARQRRLLSHGRDSVWILLWDAELELRARKDEFCVTRYEGHPDDIRRAEIKELIPQPDYYGVQMNYRGIAKQSFYEWRKSQSQ